MEPNLMEQIKIVKIKDNLRDVVEDLVTEEVPLTLIVGGEEFITLLCSPQDLEDLCAGFLFTNGLLTPPQDVEKIVIDQERWTANITLREESKVKGLVFKRLYTSGCGRGALFYNVADVIYRSKNASVLKISVLKLKDLMLSFQKRSELYLKTGGVHSAGLAQDNIFVFREDIGRHNALDKVIGRGLQDGVDFSKTLMVTSGRISSEVIFKIQKCGIPMIISRSAPTDQAVKLAKDMGLTLVGFARGTRMNIYSGAERVT
ncbi:MAG: formate dehydrogenase accessory sulfurtransferase FdhD [Elusimicrobia bacterium]|nr:formate dehydrogenase accessory sulfurtransferase FdhD [Elusimicrobiota bacterium]